MSQQSAKQEEFRPSPAKNGGEALSPLLCKLNRIARLNDDDVAAIRAWPHRIEAVGNGTYLVRERASIDHCCLLLDGYAFRSKVSGDGARQIVSFHVGGDIVDLQHLELSRADHNVQTLGDAVVAWIAVEVIRQAAATRPNLSRALWRDSLIDASIFREWVLNVGRRDARSRIAHLLCEFIFRREAAMSAHPGPFELPMTQEQIADATGLTPVHVNRTLQHLQADGLIHRDRRSFVVRDWAALRSAADFDPAYLHMASQ